VAQQVDVVVVGAGAMGSATAWWLARRGRAVALVEQFEQGHTRGSSHGATRIFRYAYPDPSYVRMVQQALPLWHDLEDDTGVGLLERTGGLDHGTPGLVAPIVDALRLCGVEHHVLTPHGAADRWPGMRFEGTVVQCPGAGRCLADLTVRTLQRRAGELGASVRFSAGPATVQPASDGVTVRASATGDEWRAPVAVVTAGAWLPSVVGDGVPLPPLRITRERLQHFTPQKPGGDWPSFLHYRTGTTHYGLLSPGEGMKVAQHMAGQEDDPDAAGPATPDPAALAAMRRYVEDWFPGLDPSPVHPATCLYTTTPTHDFVVERRGSIVLGSPCSGHGFKFTPLIGRRLADLAMEREP
jgi:sarcosine oxidase